MTSSSNTGPDDVFVLGFDTAMDACQAAIVSRSGAIVAKAHEPMKRGHAEYLIPMIGGVLEAAGLELKDLTRIGVTVGPGTFAGLRVGLSAARSFGLSHDIPIVGVTTLEAVAVTLPEPEAGQPLRAGVIAFDARNDEVYLQVVDPLGTLVVAPSVVDLETAADAVPEGLVNLSGSGAPRLADALAARSRAADVNVVDESLWAPQAEWIARLALVAPDDRVGPPSPLYLRPPDAKEPENGGALPHA